MFGHPHSTTVKPALRVDVYSHHITVCKYGDRIKLLLLQFCRGLGQYGLKLVGRRKFIRAIVAVYAATTMDRREFRFHITQKEDVLRFLCSNGVSSEDIDIVEHPLYEPVEAKFSNITGQPPRDYQIPIIGYLAAPGAIKVLPIQTGKGKTRCTLDALCVIQQRAGLVIKGMYVDQWILVLKEDYGLKTKEIMLIRGSEDLKALIAIARAGELEAKVVIITSKTLFNYYKAYEASVEGNFEYDCHPEELWKLLGVGVRIIDEVHQEFHANFRQDLYSHVPKTISLSATLESDDNFVNRMYRVMFPAECRPAALEWDKYTEVLALQYKIMNFNRIRFMGANKMYSHVKFEQSLLRQKDMLARYLDMIYRITDDQFVKIFEPGQRMLIFCATVEMCSEVRDFLRRKFQDIRIGRYVQEDDYAVLQANDIIVTTLKSAGTAIDIDGLRVAFMTDNIDSKQANIQALGRLRRLKKWPDVRPEFVYIYAGNVERHTTYHKRKKDKLRGKVLAYRDLITNFHI